ncbi:MAG: hypothetical protein NVS4B8_16440 [Herpetosiphon sp.]
MDEAEYGTLLGWLRERIHQHGAMYEPRELIQQATGGPLDAQPYLQYLRDKFSQLYEL